MQVIFSHDKESGPDSQEIMLLRGIAERLGCEVVTPDYRVLGVSEDDKLIHQGIETMFRKVQFDEPTILVGSGLGCYISALASNRKPVVGLFLMAPLYVVRMSAPKIVLVHGTNDNVSSYTVSLDIARNVSAFSDNKYQDIKSSIDVKLIPDSHKLGKSLDVLCRTFERFLLDCAAGLAAHNGAIF